MAGTRSSTRSGNNASSPSKNDAAAGTKRKPDTDADVSSERDSKVPKNQPTIDSMLESDKNDEDSEMKEAAEDVVEDAKNDDTEKELNSTDPPAEVKEESQNGDDANGTSKDTNETQTSSKADDGADKSADASKTEATEEGAIEKSSQREKQMPSNILEKGVIYFFTRNRVSVDEAESVGDLQRTFFVLRPLPTGAKLGDGTIQDSKNNRLFALPKKVFPKSHNDRFMAFVEKANTTVQDLKENFFKGGDYDTKTQGTQHTDPVTPVAEGVYMLTRTEDATTHLVYSTTIPSELGEVQSDLGIKDQGSFIISVKNPERSGPASAALQQKPDFSKEIIEEFRGLAWSEVKPKYLDHEYCQILLIGEDSGKGVEPTTKNTKHDKETPQEEIDQLEHEDELRVEHLHGKSNTPPSIVLINTDKSGDDSVFDDLKISKNDYPKVPTTW